MYWFELGREFKLSVAEIYAFFPMWKIVYFWEKILILDEVSKEDIETFSRRCGGVIKIFLVEKVLKTATFSALVDLSFDFLSAGKETWKLKYGVNVFWKSTISLRNFVPKLKAKFKEADMSSRFLNQDFQNLSSAIILWEKLAASKSDINIVYGDRWIYFWPTIWVQDINAYSKRDFGKKRDMEVWMLPPKLSQTMIQLAAWNKKSFRLYDPFCWLGTVLIESILMGNEEVYGSDLQPAMVEATMQNLDFIEENFETPAVKSAVMVHDAKKVQDCKIMKDIKVDVIVTEWYLWELFTHRDITFEKVTDERKKLALLYKDFFSGLSRVRFKWTIVISFPFWDIHGKNIYFFEVYDIIKRYCNIEKLLPTGLTIKESLSGSLFYRRSSQVVGREVFKLKMKM